MLPTLTESRVRELIDDGVITGGMIPKVTACLNALAHAQTAQIIDGRAPNALRDALEHNTGTAIVQETHTAVTARSDSLSFLDEFERREPPRSLPS